MKLIKCSALWLGLSLGALALFAQQTTNPPPAAPAPKDGPALTPEAPQPTVTNTAERTAPTAPAAATGIAAPATATGGVAPPVTNGAAIATNRTNGAAAPAYVILPNGQKGIRLNFRGAPLEAVLNHLSKAAGLVINLETPVSGKVDVWSEQPLRIDEAINLLDTVLNKNGYAALHEGKLLTILTRDRAKTRAIPVEQLGFTNRVEDIPKTDRMVTEIIPVRYANAPAMTRDLTPLLPEYATLTANESGNALVLTDTQSDIRRMAEIVRALDTSIAGIATIRVFTLRFADAKDLANEIKELFPAPSNTNGRGGPGGGFNPLAMMFGGGRGGGGFGGRGGGGFAGGGAAGSGTSEARQAASRVAAVADERTNSLVVSAPEEVMDVIDKLVREVDTNAENITELRVFHLNHADPTEMASELSSLFPDDTRTDNNSLRSAIQFGRGPFGGGFFGRPGGPGGQTTTSDRARLQGRVTAVPDPRTSSLVVTAGKDLMSQIAEMITQLDADAARSQKAYVFHLNNADSDNVQQILMDLFGSTMQNRNNRNQNNALTLRSQQAAQSIGQGIMQSTTSSGRNAFGGGGGLP